MYQKFIKRLFDLILALVSLLLLFPLIIFISFISFIIFKGNIFYCQKRVGYLNREFEIIKFRTMADAVDQEGNVLPDSHRLNSWGIFLRRFSLDEIPQLLNIFSGELSVVGPRPLLVDYLKYYTSEELNRHNVKPGLTGLAQVMGRNSITWTKRFSYDLYYAKNLCFALDVKILIKTIFQVVLGKNIHFSNSLVQERIADSFQTDNGFK